MWASGLPWLWFLGHIFSAVLLIFTLTGAQALVILSFVQFQYVLLKHLKVQIDIIGLRSCFHFFNTGTESYQFPSKHAVSCITNIFLKRLIVFMYQLSEKYDVHFCQKDSLLCIFLFPSTVADILKRKGFSYKAKFLGFYQITGKGSILQPKGIFHGPIQNLVLFRVL